MAASHSRSYWLPLAGIVCVVTGLWLALFGPPELPAAGLTVEKLATLHPQDADFPMLNSYYQPEAVIRYALRQGDDAGLLLDSVAYRPAGGEVRHALVYDPSGEQTIREAANFRLTAWKEAAEAIRTHTGENAIFLSWWDNGQRIDLLTGRRTWTRAPVNDAFGTNERKAWIKIAGPPANNETPLRQLAGWLAANAEQAVATLDAALPPTTEAYLLVCMDDLARIAEIESLSGQSFGFEARFFPQNADIHGQIAEVKQWSAATGNGNYLLQPIPGQGIRAWRIADTRTGSTLLARLLPFTGALEHPADGFEPVFRSAHGAYLSIYRLQRSANRR